ncbi:MAG: DUF1543 domain-containing protein, partial [Flavitalea sp.]
LLGCTPPGRHTEQHDLFFGIGENLRDLVPEMISFWPEANGQIHIDSWRQVSMVDNHFIQVTARALAEENRQEELNHLFFLNLGGYKTGEFEEYHYKMLTVCGNMGAAIQQAKKTAFYKHNGFKNAESHVDDKYGVDVDEVYNVEDILSPGIKEKYALRISPHDSPEEDTLQIGYLKIDKI